MCFYAFARTLRGATYTFHKLRHDYASILDKQKVTSRLAQDMLRHAQYSTTASIYQHVATEDMFAAAQAAQDWIEKALTCDRCLSKTVGNDHNLFPLSGFTRTVVRT